MRGGFQGSPSAHFIGPHNNFASYGQGNNFSSNESFVDNPWYANSGATSHVTPDSFQISNHSPYTCIESLIVGNGNSLPITCVGNARVESYKSKLKSSHTLCVYLI
ncbi:hypothetical protein Scep_012809 [Stephania cephalantha]|uniref:Uncharacterized protein n=1 Tax=Stephania cephalantha TaxID=152367 RepID=A0AAP0JFQ5_9MAGN